MKHLLTRSISLLLVLLSFSAIGTEIIAQTSTNNPIMIIRCRFDSEAATNNSGKKSDSKVWLDGTDIFAFEAPEEDCYDGEFQLDITDVDCFSTDPVVSATFCFTAAPGSPALADGEYVTFTDLNNCLNFAGDENLQELEDLYDLQTNLPETYSFGPAVGGKITVSDGIFINPTETVVVTLADGSSVTADVDCDSIPTVGQWGLTILGLIMASLGLIFITRRKLA